MGDTACKCHSTLFSLTPHSQSHLWFAAAANVESVLPCHLVRWLDQSLLQVLVGGCYEELSLDPFQMSAAKGPTPGYKPNAVNIRPFFGAHYTLETVESTLGKLDGKVEKDLTSKNSN